MERKEKKSQKRDIDAGVIVAGVGGTIVGLGVLSNFIDAKNWLGIAVGTFMVFWCLFGMWYVHRAKDKTR